MTAAAKRYVHIYTGDGKGKTTAAVGLSARALGAGWRVWFGQFIKGTPSSEFVSLAAAGGERFVHAVFGRGCFVFGTPDQADIDAAKEGLVALRDAMHSGKYDLVVADELFGAIHAKLLGEDEILSLLSKRPESVELVLTGRQAPQSIIDRADLVSEIREVKHYYTQNVPARKGIEF